MIADAAHLRSIFVDQMGLTDKDIVVLSGAHALVSIFVVQLNLAINCPTTLICTCHKIIIMLCKER